MRFDQFLLITKRYIKINSSKVRKNPGPEEIEIEIIKIKAERILRIMRGSHRINKEITTRRDSRTGSHILKRLLNRPLNSDIINNIILFLNLSIFEYEQRKGKLVLYYW